MGSAVAIVPRGSAFVQGSPGLLARPSGVRRRVVVAHVAFLAGEVTVLTDAVRMLHAVLVLRGVTDQLTIVQLLVHRPVALVALRTRSGLASHVRILVASTIVRTGSVIRHTLPSVVSVPLVPSTGCGGRRRRRRTWRIRLIHLPNRGLVQLLSGNGVASNINRHTPPSRVSARPSSAKALPVHTLRPPATRAFSRGLPVALPRDEVRVAEPPRIRGIPRLAYAIVVRSADCRAPAGVARVQPTRALRPHAGVAVRD
mmetsp:Transcript_13758/g.34583  ORF Transcript_13758/g.34583 Transcript_13758/m.34583 type:complete len:257 (-) Transcript_13758:458-1228(-)